MARDVEVVTTGKIDARVEVEIEVECRVLGAKCYNFSNRVERGDTNQCSVTVDM